MTKSRSDSDRQSIELVGAAKRPDGTFVIVLTFTNVERIKRIIAIPRDEFLAPSQVARHLAREGLPALSDGVVAALCKKIFDEVRPLSIVRLSEGSGWYDDYTVYLYGDQILGDPAPPIILPRTEAEDLTEYGIGLSEGSTKAWRKLTASFPEHSPLLVLAICSAFASVLAGPAKVESGILHWFGESTIGKTILLIVARSVFGNCYRKNLPNWNTTLTGLEEVLDQSPDQPLILDELTFKRGETEAATAIKHVTYAVTSNRRKRRSKHWAGGYNATARRGATYVLSSGEQSFKEIAADGKLTRIKGELHRAIDIPADAGAGLGIYRSLPEGIDARQYSKEIEDECGKNYGRAGRRFIKYLLSRKSDWIAHARKSTEAFYAHADVTDTRLEIRFAERFGLANAAGLLAIEAGIVDWDPEELTKAIVAVYQMARASIPDPLRHREEAIEKLRTLLSDTGKIVRAHPGGCIDATTFAANSVFLRKDLEKGRMYVLKPEMLEGLCGGKEVLRKVVSELDRREVLIRSESGKSTRQVSIGGDKNRPRLRYYCIRRDFGE